MTARILKMATLVTCFVVIFTACKKNTTDEVDYSTESTTHSDDQSRFSSESDAAANDINLAIESNGSFSSDGTLFSSAVVILSGSVCVITSSGIVK